MPVYITMGLCYRINTAWGGGEVSSWKRDRSQKFLKKCIGVPSTCGRHCISIVGIVRLVHETSISELLSSRTTLRPVLRWFNHRQFWCINPLKYYMVSAVFSQEASSLIQHISFQKSTPTHGVMSQPSITLSIEQRNVSNIAPTMFFKEKFRAAHN